MKYEIIGKTVPVVEITLNRGEVVYTQSGGMTYQSDGISMSTNTRGGFLKGLGRAFSGESLFLANYKAEKDNAVIAFATTVPGNIIPVDLRNMPYGLIVQKGSFLCAEDDVTTQVQFTKRFTGGLFGGEGFILQKLSGNGHAFLEVDGDPIIKTLAPNEVLKVDTSNVVAFEPSVSYDIETVKGLGNIFFGGEGLFLTKLVGPGKVILQSQNFVDFAGKIIRLIPNND